VGGIVLFGEKLGRLRSVIFGTNSQEQIHASSLARLLSIAHSQIIIPVLPGPNGMTYVVLALMYTLDTLTKELRLFSSNVEQTIVEDNR
jgi:hypothetical protein